MMYHSLLLTTLKRLCLALLFVTLAHPASAAPASAIMVSAAASLTDVFTELARAFEKAHPEIRVHTQFAASNPLLKQMEEGAPVDIFASADQETMDRAAAGKLIDPASRVDFARNALVMIVPAVSGQVDPTAPRLPEDLRNPRVQRIAVGNPDSVPAGRYAREALTPSGLWEELRPKYIFATNVRQALTYVRQGEVDAGFVYRTDALTDKENVAIATVVAGKPITYPLAVATTGDNAAGAALFRDFVRTPEGQAILEKHGFDKP